MTVYRYQDTSPIDSIAIRKSAGGGVRTYLFSKNHIEASRLESLQQSLSQQHMSCVATEMDGRDCMEIRGCRDIAALEALLKPAGLLKGTSSIDNSDNPKFSLKDKIKNNLVAIYGIINVIADFGIIAYGRMKRKLSPAGNKAWEEEVSGYAYSAGSLMFTFFGRGDKSDFHAKDIALGLKDELHKRGIELADDSAASSFIARKVQKSTFRKIRERLSKGGSDAGNFATGTAGALIALGAARNPSGNKGMARFGEGMLGATTALSGYGAALIEEKEPDPNNPPHTPVESIKQKIQAKPNMLAGYGYALSTVMHGAEAVDGMVNAEKKHPGKADYARKAYAFRGVFAGMNFLGELALATASKGHGSGVKSDMSIENTALSIVADAIVRQPEEQRQKLVKDLSHNFLAAPKILGGDAADIETKLNARVQKLDKNPWLCKTCETPAAATTNKNQSGPESGKKWTQANPPKPLNEQRSAASASIV